MTAEQERRANRYDQVRELHETGAPIKAIAERLGMHRRTVRLFLRSDSCPERAVRPKRPSQLGAYLPYLTKRGAEGCRCAATLWREINEQGFRGCEGSVRRLVADWRPELPDDLRRTRRERPKVVVPSARRTAWLLSREELDEETASFLERLNETWPEAKLARDLARAFKTMVCAHRVVEFEGWLERARASGIREFRDFAVSLERDKAAVRAAIELLWSNGQVEGQVHRIKAIKRSMYGRAKFDLLRQRVLWAS